MSGKNIKSEIVEIPLSMIRTDGGTQLRVEMRQEVIDEYAGLWIGNEVEFPPVEVFHDRHGYHLWDGFYRTASAKAAGKETILAHVQKGSQRDAIEAACGANSAHGQPRSNEDKRRAVFVMLRDEVWSQLSDRQIATKCAVCHTSIARWRRELEESQNGSQVEQLPATDDEPTGVVTDDDPAPRPASTTKHNEGTRKTRRCDAGGSNAEPIGETVAGEAVDDDAPRNFGSEFKQRVESMADELFTEGLSAIVAAAVLEALACQWRS